MLQDKKIKRLGILLMASGFLLFSLRTQFTQAIESVRDLILLKGEKVNVECPEGKININPHSLGLTVECVDKVEAAEIATEPVSSVTPTPISDGWDTTNDYVYCDDNDPTKFHKLFNENDNCWYDHEHGDNPHEVDDIFGPVGGWWGSAQEISYPWQTYVYDGNTSGGGNNFPVRTGGYENEAKHEGYKWYVRRDLPCTSQFTDGCVRAFRTIDHAIGHAHGAIVRYHSFATEMLVCPEANPNDCGIIRTGGWQDKGILAIDDNLLTEFGPRGTGGTRLHHQNMGNSNFGTWYGGTWLATTVQQFEDMWGLVKAENPREMHFFCPNDPSNCGDNNSKRQIHLVGAGVRGAEVRWLNQHGYVSGGKVNFEGYNNRYGEIVKDGRCNKVGIDCVPLELTNFTTGILHQYRGDAREYDTSIGILPESPIRFPN